MAVTRVWKVYGAPGHRQRESFCESYSYDWSEGDDVKKIEVENSDKTGTNLYTIIRITRNTPDECEELLDSQLSDGIFENSRVGAVKEITNENESTAENTGNTSLDCKEEPAPQLSDGTIENPCVGADEMTQEDAETIKIYNLYENGLEIDYSKRAEIKEGCTLIQNEQWPELIQSFDNKEDALEALKNYTSTVYKVPSYCRRYFDVTEYYVEELEYEKDEYDEDGDNEYIAWVNREILDTSPMQIELVETPSYDTIGVFDNYEDAEQAYYDYYDKRDENEDEDYEDYNVYIH